MRIEIQITNENHETKRNGEVNNNSTDLMRDSEDITRQTDSEGQIETQSFNDLQQSNRKMSENINQRGDRVQGEEPMEGQSIQSYSYSHYTHIHAHSRTNRVGQREKRIVCGAPCKKGCANSCVALHRCCGSCSIQRAIKSSNSAWRGRLALSVGDAVTK